MTILEIDDILVFHRYNKKSVRILWNQGIDHFKVDELNDDASELIHSMENSDKYIKYENKRRGHLYVRCDINDSLQTSYFTSSKYDQEYYVDIETNKQLYFYYDDKLYLLLKTHLYEFTVVVPPDGVNIDIVRNNFNILDNI